MSKCPCYARLTSIEVAKLYRIIHETVLDFCGHHGLLDAHRLANLYGQYLKWKDELPDAVQDVEGDVEALPHTLFLQ